MPELLEELTLIAAGELGFCLRKFYNASDIFDGTPEFQSLENALDLIKKYADLQGADICL